MSGGDFSRMESPGQLNTPGSRTSSVLPDLLTQVITRFLAHFLCRQKFFVSMKEFIYKRVSNSMPSGFLQSWHSKPEIAGQVH
jgi:hypothetical protein